MSKNSKAQPKRLGIGACTHCTSYGVAKRFQLADFNIPIGLYNALKNSSNERAFASVSSKSYINCIKSLSNVKVIYPEEYLFLFKIFLYMEHYEVLQAAKKHSLKNHTINKIDVENCFYVKIPASGDDETLVDVGDKVIIIVDQQKKNVYHGRIIRLESGCASVCLQKKKPEPGCPRNWEDLLNKRVDIRFIPLNFSVQCCHYVLNTLFKYNLTGWLFPKMNTTCKPALDRELDWQDRSVGKNEEQRQAVLNILNRSSHPAPYILFGPPGTGKTSTLAEAVCQIWKRGKSDYVLVCAQSNAAANEITKRLVKVIPDRDIYRMYTTSCKAVPPQIENCSNIVDDTVVFLPKEIILSKRIVVSTLVTCIRLETLNLRYDHFSYIFIDEVSQSVEPETLIPLTLTIKDKGRDSIIARGDKSKSSEIHAQIIIAGDPHQLGPVVKCQLIQHLYGKSLIERLLDCEPYQKRNGKYNPCYITKLVRNFRSREPILHVSNKLFYENELKACATSNALTITLAWPQIQNKTFPIVFCSVKGEETRTKSRSVYNKAEICVVIQYVNKLLQTKLGGKIIRGHDIGIVTPFREQQFRIRECLQEMDIKHVTVGTVEVFQGQEKPVMIFSTVRSKCFVNDGVEHIGHLSNPKRFNVALTRAQLLLIVVGNADVLCKEHCWQELILYCKGNDACIDVDVINIENEATAPQEKKNKKKGTAKKTARGSPALKENVPV